MPRMGGGARQAVVSVLVNVRRALCAVALVAGLALAGCGHSTSGDTASGTPQGDAASSGSGSGSPGPGSTAGGGGSGGSNTGGGGSGGGSVPKPGAPPECSEIATAPALHEIGDTLDKMDNPDTAAAAKATLHTDADQLNGIASHTGDGTLKTRLTVLAAAINNVASSGTDNMGTMLAFATALRDVSTTVQDVCGIGIG